MLWALSASALVHLWMVGGIAPVATRIAVPSPAQMLEARIERVGAPGEPPEPAHEVVRPERPELFPATTRARGGTARESSPAAPRTGAPSGASDNEAMVSDTERPAPAPVDPVYYSERELDVYPAPLAPLQFEYPAHLAGARIGGDVLARLMVDEAGTVHRVAVIAAEPLGYFEEHARAKLASVRFSPGRRQGRAVKSQVTVRISFDPAARAGALR